VISRTRKAIMRQNNWKKNLEKIEQCSSRLMFPKRMKLKVSYMIMYIVQYYCLDINSSRMFLDIKCCTHNTQIRYDDLYCKTKNTNCTKLDIRSKFMTSI
jgi:hypothetical protein